MRFLIVSAVLACAAAAPSGSLLGAPLAYSAQVALTPALPTISAGDINGAAIDAHVEASDHYRAAVDATRQLNDKANELNGEAINNAVENGWRAVDAVKTVEAQLDGAAAGAAPVIAKSLVRTPVATYATAPVATYATAPVATYATAPVATYAAAPVAYPAAPIAYGASPIEYSAAYGASPFGYAASPLNYAHAW